MERTRPNDNNKLKELCLAIVKYLFILEANGFFFFFFVVLCQSFLLVPSPYNELYFLNLNLSVTEKIVTSDDVCCNMRNVKFIKVMQFKQMFVTAVCILFLLKVTVLVFVLALRS